MSNKEIRSLEEVRTSEETDMVVSGYALKWDTWSEDLGGFVETIDKEALKDTDLSDVRCYFNHDSSMVLGRTSSGTLELELDSTGLYFRCQLPDTSYGRDLFQSIKRSDINQCSFGFIIDNEDGDTFNKRSDGMYERIIRKIKSLWEISIVSMPAYSDTSVAVAQRSIEKLEQEELDKVKEAEQREIELLKLKLELRKLKK